MDNISTTVSFDNWENCRKRFAKANLERGKYVFYILNILFKCFKFVSFIWSLQGQAQHSETAGPVYH